MKVTMITNVIDAFGTVTKGLVLELRDLEIRGRVDTIQMTVLLNRPEYIEELRRLAWERPSANAGVKNSQKVT